MALTKGLNDVVRASLTGSILGNLLLVAGGAMVVGGWKREKQVFSQSAAKTNAGHARTGGGVDAVPRHLRFHLPDRSVRRQPRSQHEQAISSAPASSC